MADQNEIAHKNAALVMGSSTNFNTAHNGSSQTAKFSLWTQQHQLRWSNKVRTGAVTMSTHNITDKQQDYKQTKLLFPSTVKRQQQEQQKLYYHNGITTTKKATNTKAFSYVAGAQEDSNNADNAAKNSNKSNKPYWSKFLHAQNAKQTNIINQLSPVPITKSPHSIHCLRRPPLWQSIAANKSDHLVEQQQQQRQLSDKTMKPESTGKTGASIRVKMQAFIIEFLQGSSIHGFIYLAKIGLSLAERMLWFAFICIAIFAIISLSHRTWQRFQTSPMVISMDRNKLIWNTSFPSLTLCPHKHIDELKLEDYILAQPSNFPNETIKQQFRNFIIKLADLTYDNLETLPLNNSFGISSSNYLAILHELKLEFMPEINSGTTLQMFLIETQTEFGICFSANSLVARYTSFDYWRSGDWRLLNHGDLVTVHPLDGEIYAQIINISANYNVYFHGPRDVPSITKQHYTFYDNEFATVDLTALEIFTSDDARSFSTTQRKCRFQYEAENMLTMPIYSFGLCLSECRMFLALKACGCVPHFYRNSLRNGRVLPVCDLEGIACLIPIKHEIISLKSKRYDISCNCLANCDDSNFFLQSYRSRPWFLGTSFQWGLIDYPKMQLRRNVLFSFADVLVYIGGLVGFFLGCSALSFTEIIYYFTVRLIKRLFFN